MSQCVKNGCQNKGEWAVKVHLPAKGWSLAAHTPVSVISDMPLCRDHAEEENLLEDFPDLRRALCDILESNGLAEPDFDRAWTEPVRRSSKEFAEFEKSRAKHMN
ncbi:hypothetical protein FIU89_11275 [Roseovarius sp. THAF27]|uniref:hypothetical protein n=1 Tax=Roseovarius sp. THAF27 TaxID=2587850 RepID=UPI0012693345|nr:hypothetical protein [Roseovarius sp. THAF27]QFT81191.1 hypothetical protein FIU89_11275 [Roseovarius sp. THAF27]